MANLGPAIENTFTELAEKPLAELTPEMRLGAKQLYYLLVNRVRGKALALVRSAAKTSRHRSMETISRLSTSPMQLDGTQQCSWESLQLGWDSRGAANMFPDQLTEWGTTNPRVRRIAVLASHAPESIRNVVRLAAYPANGNCRAVRQKMSEFLQFVRICDKDGQGVESEPSSANATLMDVDRVGKGKGKGCFVCGRPSHAAKDCKFNQAKGNGQGKGKTKTTSTDKNTPAKFEGECRHCGKKGHTLADCWKRLAEAKDKKVHAVDGAPSTATVRHRGDR